MNGNTQTLPTRLREEPSFILSGLEMLDKARNGLISSQAGPEPNQGVNGAGL